MGEDTKVDVGDNDTADTIREDTNAISGETKDLVIEAKTSLVILIGVILIMSLLSILLSTWLAKTITNTPSSFGSILSRYFGFDRNETEPSLTWWTPTHSKSNEIKSRKTQLNKTNSTTATRLSSTKKIPDDDHPEFHTIVLPLFFVGAIILAALAYYARVRCTNRGFAWGAVPKLPFGRIDPRAAVETVIKAKEEEPGVDYTIVQGTKDEPIVFALADTTQLLNEEREPGVIIDEGTQYDIEDIPKVITRVSSAPDLQANNIQTVPSSKSPSDEQQHMIELLQRQPLPTLSPST
ncbi:unnamed protein product [Adineta steineri]|uniref:Uncharacterized protein n=1 Tax=Adineta steineri TaxID=433720 RepID=A0A813MDM9_9BILA|nr:unnamed protein product [Adineta steineri]CAF3931853.1 unnamed protein product [Adineta steineri]